MAKKKDGIISKEEEQEEISRAQVALKKMKALEKKKAKKLKKIQINRGYVMTNQPEQWREYNETKVKIR